MFDTFDNFSIQEVDILVPLNVGFSEDEFCKGIDLILKRRQCICKRANWRLARGLTCIP